MAESGNSKSLGTPLNIPVLASPTDLQLGSTDSEGSSDALNSAGKGTPSSAFSGGWGDWMPTQNQIVMCMTLWMLTAVPSHN